MAEQNKSGKKKLHLLLVEDSIADIELAKRMLTKSKFDYDISIAKDGEEALTQLSRDNKLPDLVLLDLNLPKKTGRQVIEEINGMPWLSKTPLVLFTTSNEVADIIEDSSHQHILHITKPRSIVEFKGIAERIDEFVYSAN